MLVEGFATPKRLSCQALLMLFQMSCDQVLYRVESLSEEKFP